MKREELSKEKQKEYYMLIDKMMSEIEIAEEGVYPLPEGALHTAESNAANKKRQEITNRYLDKIRALFE